MLDKEGRVLTDAELVKIAEDFREGMIGSEPSAWRCAMVCMPLAGMLRAIYGMKVECVETDLGEMNHVWIKLPDSRVLDPTGDQFNDYGFGPKMPKVYIGPPLVYHGEEK